MIATGVALAAQVSLAFADEAEAKKETAVVEAKKADVEVTIEGGNTLQFDKKEFSVKEGQVVALTFKNAGTIPKAAMGHNVVVLTAGTDVVAFTKACVANAQTTGLPSDEALKKQVVASSKMLGPGEADTVTFTAPVAGKYDYICTFIGHSALMKGVMTVEAK